MGCDSGPAFTIGGVSVHHFGISDRGSLLVVVMPNKVYLEL